MFMGFFMPEKIRFCNLYSFLDFTQNIEGTAFLCICGIQAYRFFVFVLFFALWAYFRSISGTG